MVYLAEEGMLKIYLVAQVSACHVKRRTMEIKKFLFLIITCLLMISISGCIQTPEVNIIVLRPVGDHYIGWNTQCNSGWECVQDTDDYIWSDGDSENVRLNVDIPFEYRDREITDVVVCGMFAGERVTMGFFRFDTSGSTELKAVNSPLPDFVYLETSIYNHFSTWDDLEDLQGILLISQTSYEVYCSQVWIEIHLSE